MKILLVFALLSAGYGFSLWKWGGLGQSVMTKIHDQYEWEKKFQQNEYEKGQLTAKVAQLEFEVSQLKSQNKILTAKAAPKIQTRGIASIQQVKTEDLVQYDIYQWSPEKLLAIGEKELYFKNYKKSAQFYNEFLERFPRHELLNDKVLFGAGVAAFETKDYYPWAEKHLSTLVKGYPKSQFYRGAKLWLALTQYNMGDQQKFLKTVEEFRLKYRNTEEWKILSKYYEDINYKVKN